MLNNWLINDFTKDITPCDIKDFDEFIKKDDYSPKPFNEFKKFGWNCIRYWMHIKGVYSIITEEVYDILDREIGESSIIEIGAGTGIMSRTLGINISTDNKIQQGKSEYAKMMRLYYGLAGQPRIKYPDWVIKLDGNEAVRRYRPDTVICSYVTQGSTEAKECEDFGFNYHGPDLMQVLNNCRKLIFIGNDNIAPHVNMGINAIYHKKINPIGLITRGDPRTSFISIWDRDEYVNKGYCQE